MASPVEEIVKITVGPYGRFISLTHQKDSKEITLRVYSNSQNDMSVGLNEDEIRELLQWLFRHGFAVKPDILNPLDSEVKEAILDK
jgi:hypothetical protein